MMNSQSKTAAVFGATGLIGQSLLRLLISEERYSKVIAPTRNPLQMRLGKVENPQFSFSSDLGLRISGATDIDDAFCCLGSTISKAGSQEKFAEIDLHAVVACAKWTLERGAKHFLVVSSMGASAQSSVFYNRTKGQMEDALKTLGFQRLSIFRPSLLLGEREDSRPLEKFSQAVAPFVNPFLKGSLRHYRAISSEVVAAAMLAEATRPSPPGVQTLLSGDIERI